jgi:hypothetical protein
MNQPKSTLNLFALATLGLVGCFPTQEGIKVGTPPDVPITPIAQDFQSEADLKASTTPPKLANIILSGTSIPVVLQEKRTQNVITYTWIVDSNKESGEPVEVESEKYFFNGKLFSFAATAHEQYNPPINLIRYPMTVGDTWEWAGDVIFGKTKAKAKATITTSAEEVNLDTGKFSALKVNVEVNFEANSAPKKRELTFFFKPGEGLIRRELWASSTRTPRNPETATTVESE